MFGNTRPFAPLVLIMLALIAISAACSANFWSAAEATATPTKTPRRLAATATPAKAALVELPTFQPSPTRMPTETSTATPIPPSATPVPASATPVPASATPIPPPNPIATLPAATAATATVPATAPTLRPTQPPALPTTPPVSAAEFVISELRVLGLGENNGGIEVGGQYLIFITVLDAAGNPLDGATLVNTAEFPMQVVSGSKGAGKAEIVMDRMTFRLKVENVNGQPVTSQVSHNMSLIEPVPADIAGKLGDVCPTVNNCPLPPYKHFSYNITFRRTR